MVMIRIRVRYRVRVGVMVSVRLGIGLGLGFSSGQSQCVPPFRSGNYTNPSGRQAVYFTMPPVCRITPADRGASIKVVRGLVARRAGLRSLTVVQLVRDDVFGCRGLMRIPHIFGNFGLLSGGPEEEEEEEEEFIFRTKTKHKDE